MRVIKIKVEKAAYCTYKWPYTSGYWDYVVCNGPCFDCDDEQIGKGDYSYAQIKLEGATHADAIKYASSMPILDMRTLEMVKAGCCPPGLINEILEGDPD